MLSQIHTCSLQGVDAVAVNVEVLTSKGENPNFQIVGLGDSAVKEARGRVLSALRASRCFPPNIILVNLAPAEVKKEGATFDLPMAIGVAASCRTISPVVNHETFFFGELSLDGTVRPVRGVIALTIAALERGAHTVVVPIENVAEASLVSGINVIGIHTLSDAFAVAEGRDISPLSYPVVQRSQYILAPTSLNLSQVRGQSIGKRAMMIAAAGGHNLMFVGPPGCGKSMLAERFGGLLPPLGDQERFETVKIHSIAGLDIQHLLAGQRPFRSPHHVISDVGLIGGGATPKPGEISLAHRGVLFLDEFPEYKRSALEAMRGPLESGKVRISRARGSILMPAKFQLLAAMNPCPCGCLGSRRRCSCSEIVVQNYMRKLSQPILERIDLHIELEEVPFEELTQGVSRTGTEDESHLVDRVCELQSLQISRQDMLNAALGIDVLASTQHTTRSSISLLESVTKRSLISARSFVRVLRIARTIADWESSALINEQHVAEAVSFRALDRRALDNRGAHPDAVAGRAGGL